MPVLLVILGGLIDWGNVLMAELTLITATRDAARFAADSADPAGAALGRLQAATPVLGIRPPSAATTIRIQPDPVLGEDVLQLHVVVPYTPVLGLVPTPAVLTADVAMLLVNA